MIFLKVTTAGVSRTLILAAALCLALFMAVPARAQQTGAPSSLAGMLLMRTFPNDSLARELAEAAARGDVAGIDRLIAAGADVNAVGANGLTVTAWVAAHPDMAGLRRLLERGADPNKIWPMTRSDQRSLVHWAVGVCRELGPEYLRMVLTLGKGDPNLPAGADGARPVECLSDMDAGPALALLRQAGARLDDPLLMRRETREVNGDYLAVFYCLEHGAANPATANGREGLATLREAVERALRNGWIAGRPWHPQYMWFWRCVDLLERRGVRFAATPPADGVTSRRPPLRPRALDATSAEAALMAPAPWRAAHFDVSLEYPGPLFFSPPAGWPRSERQPVLRRARDLVEYTYPDAGHRVAGEEALLRVTFLRAPGMTLRGAVDDAARRFPTVFGRACSSAALTGAADHVVLRLTVAGAPGVGGCMYVGVRGDTVVVVRQEWKCAAPALAEWYAGRARQDMSLVLMRPAVNAGAAGSSGLSSSLRAWSPAESGHAARAGAFDASLPPGPRVCDRSACPAPLGGVR